MFPFESSVLILWLWTYFHFWLLRWFLVLLRLYISGPSAYSLRLCPWVKHLTLYNVVMWQGNSLLLVSEIWQCAVGTLADSYQSLSAFQPYSLLFGSHDVLLLDYTYMLVFASWCVLSSPWIKMLAPCRNWLKRLSTDLFIRSYDVKSLILVVR